MSESITISVTIPKQLNKFIVLRSNRQGISRSRYISTIILEHQDKIIEKTIIENLGTPVFSNKKPSLEEE